MCDTNCFSLQSGLTQYLPKANQNIFQIGITIDLSGITEWLLNICDTRIYEKKLASNACTVLQQC